MPFYLTLSAHAREGYSSHFVCQSVCQSVCHFSILEKAPFSGLKLTSVYILGDDLSLLNVALFENQSYFEEIASETSAVTAVMYAGTAQPLNGLARDRLARSTWNPYQSCYLCCSCFGFFPSRSCRLVDCFPFQLLVS